MNTTQSRSHSRLVILLGLSLAVSQSWAAERLTPYEQLQRDADKAYAEGLYDEAYANYDSLARRGDNFSQYRLSYMNFQGQGTDADMAEAFAWAVLAAQGNNPQLIKYLGALAREVPVEEEKRATFKAKEYLDRWGAIAVANNARLGAKREIRSCTGSRLGSRCEEVYAMQMPRFWKIQGKGMWKDPSNPKIGSASYSTGNGVGAEVLNTSYYQSLRWGAKDIEIYLAEHAGVVEIGELETVDVVE